MVDFVRSDLHHFIKNNIDYNFNIFKNVNIFGILYINHVVVNNTAINVDHYHNLINAI